MSKQIPRVVFDCNVFVQAIINRNSPAGKCLKLAENDEICLLVSPAILAEVEDILSRPAVRKFIENPTDDLLDMFIRGILKFATSVSKIRSHFALERDPDDEPYLNLAIEAEADFLVSWDKDLLDLMTSYTDVAKDFRRRFRKIRIIDPAEFLTVIERPDLSIAP